MKRRACHEIPIKDLTGLPADFSDRVTAPHVAELAESIDKIGLLHEPIVRHGTNQLVTGADRTAAHVALGRDTIRVEFWDFDSAQEVEEVREAENAHRRHDPEERRKAILKLVDIYHEQEVARDEEARSNPNAPYRDKHPKTRARERVAERFGLEPESVRKIEQREKARQERAQEPAPQAAERKEYHVRQGDYALVTDEWLEGTERVHAALSGVDNAVRKALADLTRLEDSGTPVHAAHVKRLKEDLSAAASLARAIRPYESCPFCKLIPEVQAGCTHCGGSGYSNINQREFIKELARGAEVQFRGQWLPISEFGVVMDEPEREYDALDVEPDSDEPAGPDSFPGEDFPSEEDIEL